MFSPKSLAARLTGAAKRLLSVAALVFVFNSAVASNVVFCFTNSATGLRDTNDFKIISQGTIRNSDGTFNTRGLPVRVANPTGIVTNYLVPQYYQVTNQFLGNGFLIRVFDASSNVVFAGDPSIYCGTANPFIELIVTTNNLSAITNGATGVNLSGTFTDTANNGLATTNYVNAATNNLTTPSFIYASGGVTNGSTPTFNGAYFKNNVVITNGNLTVSGAISNSGGIFVTSNGVTTISMTTNGNFTASGNVTAAAFVGGGAGLTDIPASSIIGNFKISGSNLTAYVSAGKIIMADGNYLSLPATNVLIQDNCTNYIVYNLNSEIHCFRRFVDSSLILVGTVITSSGVPISIIQPQTFLAPKTRLAHSLSLISSGNNLSVIKLGDSILNGSGPTNILNSYANLVFNTLATNRTWLLSNSTNITIYDYSMGGTAAIFGNVMLGKIVTQPRDGSSLGYADIAFHYGTYLSFLNGITNQIGTFSPWKQSDLAVVQYVNNHGDDYLQYIETLVRKLRSKGIDVIVMTGSQQYGLSNVFSDMGGLLKRICDCYGADLCDSWSYIREASDNGQTVLSSDTVHPNELGSILYADAVRSELPATNIVLNAETISPPFGGMVTLGVSPVDYSYIPTTNYVFFPHSADVILTPHWTDGTWTNSNYPTLNYFSKLTGITNRVLVLTAGQSAVYWHSRIRGLLIFRENVPSYTSNSIFTVSTLGWSGSTITISTNDMATQPDSALTLRSTYISPHYIDPILTNSPGSLIYADTFFANGYKPAGLVVKCWSNTLYLPYIAVMTDSSDDVSFDKCAFYGTGWSSEVGQFASQSYFTDTIGDYVIIPFSGRGVDITVNSRTSSGILSWQMDDYNSLTSSNSAISFHDTLRGGGTFLDHLYLFPSPEAKKFNYGSENENHLLKLWLSGTNASSASPATGNHRLQIYGIQTIKNE